VIGPHGDIVCLEAASGKEVWHRNLRTDFSGQMHSGWGYSESPLVDGQKVVCTPGAAGAGIAALDKHSGSEIWRAAIPAIGDRGGDGAAYSSIVVTSGGGVRQYVQLMGRGAVGVAAKDGTFLWGYNRVANGTANVPTPVVHGDYVFCSSGYQTGAALLRLHAAGDGVNAEEVYFLDGKEFQNHHGGMILVGDHIYAGHGHNAGAPTCLEWKTGKTLWRQNRGPGTGSAAVTFADGNLYFRFENGVMALVGATPQGYQEKGRFQIPDVEQPSWSHPVVAGGRLFLREQDALLCYDVKK
jgi:outer membrane protein assembly factor BamB